MLNRHGSPAHVQNLHCAEQKKQSFYIELPGYIFG